MPGPMLSNFQTLFHGTFIFTYEIGTTILILG